MRPQKDEPCVSCKAWSNKTGCRKGNYNSAAMIIFGFCGRVEPKTQTAKISDDNGPTYRISRYTGKGDRHILERGLTIQEARKKLSQYRDNETTWCMIELENPI